MTTGGNRLSDETTRLKQDFKEDFKEELETFDDDEDGDLSSKKLRRSWKDDNRRQDRQSKKQRQRNPEWND
tara:strand:+ start:1365 stop:1577 length:213 start_codon:yes stop_codon:yes gene_type:complete